VVVVLTVVVVARVVVVVALVVVVFSLDVWDELLLELLVGLVTTATTKLGGVRLSLELKYAP